MKKTLKKHGGTRENSGRKPSGNAKSANLGCVRMHAEELKILKNRAKSLGIPFSDFVRGKLGLETAVNSDCKVDSIQQAQ